jgi:clan AA aspartic protease
MVRGTFDTSGSPVINVEVSGPSGPRRNLTAIVDTGFTGFLSIPSAELAQVGLAPTGAALVILADQTPLPTSTCIGTAHLGSESRVGIIVIDVGGVEVLLGMDFLRKFGKRLIVDPANDIVELQP